MRKEFETDILISCSPCQPYSEMRSHGGDAESEKGYSVMFGSSGSVLSQVRSLLPTVFLSEQVRGFEKPRKGQSTQSPKDRFVEEVLAVTRPDGELHFAGGLSFNMDSECFVQGSRPRSPGRFCALVECSNF